MKLAPPPRKCSASLPVSDSYTWVTSVAGWSDHDTRSPRGVRLTTTVAVRSGSSVATV